MNSYGEIDFKNLIVVKVKNISGALRLLKSGNTKRRVSSTTMKKKVAGPIAFAN